MTTRGTLPVAPELLTPVTLRLEGDCPTYARSHIRGRGHEVVIDEPPERDGTDEGPAPTEMQIAALIGVTNVILKRLARRDGIAIQRLKVVAEATLDRRGVWLAEPIANPWPRIRLQLSIATDADDERLKIWATDLERFSPIHTTLRAAGTELIQEWVRTPA